MGFFVFVMSGALVMACLAVVLHLQFGVAGIVNFGIVGFVGIGSYATGILHIDYDVPILLALLGATAIVGVVAAVFGWIVLDLDSQSVLVATLAFATLVSELVVSEDQVTRGVSGLGTVPFPIDIGDRSDQLLAGLLVVSLGLLVWYSMRLQKQPFGRLLLAVRDNEVLAKSLGKSTSQHKLVFFVATSAVMGLLGGLNASIDHFLTPNKLTTAVTFTVWIALILGGKGHPFGAIAGTLATVVLFDVVIETYVDLPADYAVLVPTIKLFVYGLMLVLLLLLRPAGLVRETSRLEHSRDR